MFELEIEAMATIAKNILYELQKKDESGGWARENFVCASKYLNFVWRDSLWAPMKSKKQSSDDYYSVQKISDTKTNRGYHWSKYSQFL